MANPLHEAFAAVFSRLFPRTQDIDIQIHASPDATYIFVDACLTHKDGTHRITDLKNIPSRIKVGSKYVRISKKNQHTLRQLADWDPSFDVRKGFVFYEKDIPEILNYLRSKASVHFSKDAGQIIIDSRPLQYVHDVSQADRGLEVKTSLTDPDGTIQIENESDARFPENSKYLHAPSGYYKKPTPKQYKTFKPEIGSITLSGDQIPLFLLYDLKRLKSEQRTHVSESVESQRVVTSAFEPKVSLHVDGPWIWFDVRYQSDRFKLPYEQIDTLQPHQQFIQEDEAWIQVDRLTHGRVTDQIAQIPQVEKLEDGFRTPAYNYYEVQCLLEQIAHIDESEAYARFLRSLENFSQIEEQPLPYSLRAPLRTYQKHGYDWICFLRQYGLNGILADEMGLGKTVQALAGLLDMHAFPDAGTSLIVCPTTVLSAWEEEIRKFTSPVDFRLARYMGGDRKNVLRDRANFDALLTTYNIVARDVEDLAKVAWQYVILDEAQKIKNHETATAKACKKLIAKHKLALTGTPIENRLSELWSIYDFLMPSYLGAQNQFKYKYEIPIIKHANRKAIEELKKRINPFKLRRLKNQVASELPEKILMDRYCELTPEQVDLYRRFAASEQERIRNLPGTTVRIDTSILTAILRLKQICCHPALVTHHSTEIYGRSGKLEAFQEILDEIMENEEKALVFSQFTEMLAILRRVFDDKKIPHFYLDGATPERKRGELKKAFQDGAAPFFLISLRAGGLGMTLTEANCVVHYDRWWNPAVEDQATDRVHRIGQDKPVKVFRIHTVGTIEERIGELLVKKKDLFDSVIEVDDLRKEISKQDLLDLFSPPK